MSTKFFDTWRQKGILNPHRRQWSAQAPDGRVILTIWNNQGLDDTEVRYVGGRDVLQCVPGAWVAEGPGKRWLDDARNCMTSGIPAEVIHLRGRRTPAPSHVRIAFVDNALMRSRSIALKLTGRLRVSS